MITHLDVNPLLVVWGRGRGVQGMMVRNYEVSHLFVKTIRTNLLKRSHLNLQVKGRAGAKAWPVRR